MVTKFHISVETEKTVETYTSLTHFSSIFHFYTPWKRQKTKDFMTFFWRGRWVGGIEMDGGLGWSKLVVYDLENT